MVVRKGFVYVLILLLLVFSIFVLRAHSLNVLTLSESEKSYVNAYSSGGISVVSYCGDGILDRSTGEMCDDGNQENSDGCSSECLTEN